MRSIAATAAFATLIVGCGTDGADSAPADGGDTVEATEPDAPTAPAASASAEPMTLEQAREVCSVSDPIAFTATAADGTRVTEPQLPVQLALATSPRPGQTWLVFADQLYDFLSFSEKAPGTVTIVLRLTSPETDPFASATYRSSAGEVEVQWTVDADGALYSAAELGSAAEVVVDAAAPGVVCGRATISFADDAGAVVELDAPIAAPIQAWVQ